MSSLIRPGCISRIMLTRQQPIRRGRRVVLENRQGLACRAKVASAAIHHWYLANPRQRLQGPAGFRRSPSLYDRKGRRGDAAAQVAHLFQPNRSARVQELRGSRAETDHCVSAFLLAHLDGYRMLILFPVSRRRLVSDRNKRPTPRDSDGNGNSDTMDTRHLDCIVYQTRYLSPIPHVLLVTFNLQRCMTVCDTWCGSVAATTILYNKLPAYDTHKTERLRSSALASSEPSKAHHLRHRIVRPLRLLIRLGLPPLFAFPFSVLLPCLLFCPLGILDFGQAGLEIVICRCRAVFGLFAQLSYTCPDLPECRAGRSHRVAQLP